MITINILINGKIKESIDAVNTEPNVLHEKWDYWVEQKRDPKGDRMYIVNGQFEIWHKRIEGHRVLARKMLGVIQENKP